MFRTRYIGTGVLLALLFGGVPNRTLGPPVAYAQEAKGEALRPEVSKPLQAAQELVKAQKYKEALAKTQEAAAVANKTPYEVYIIERMRGTVVHGQ